MINKVNKKECLDALEYFWQVEDLEDSERDKIHYLIILMKKVANDYNIKLEGI
tara:strand:+ start:133 stop:291 length:159 start_codon:yes stop_codon:yes gene_type:complete